MPPEWPPLNGGYKSSAKGVALIKGVHCSRIVVISMLNHYVFPDNTTSSSITWDGTQLAKDMQVVHNTISTDNYHDEYQYKTYSVKFTYSF